MTKAELKQAVVEALRGEREFIREVVLDALEDVGLSAAIEEGRRTPPVSRDDVFRVLDDEVGDAA